MNSIEQGTASEIEINNSEYEYGLVVVDSIYISEFHIEKFPFVYISKPSDNKHYIGELGLGYLYETTKSNVYKNKMSVIEALYENGYIDKRIFFIKLTINRLCSVRAKSSALRLKLCASRFVAQRCNALGAIVFGLLASELADKPYIDYTTLLPNVNTAKQIKAKKGLFVCSNQALSVLNYIRPLLTSRIFCEIIFLQAERLKRYEGNISVY